MLFAINFRLVKWLTGPMMACLVLFMMESNMIMVSTAYSALPSSHLSFVSSFYF